MFNRAWRLWAKALGDLYMVKLLHVECATGKYFGGFNK